MPEDVYRDITPLCYYKVHCERSYGISNPQILQELLRDIVQRDIAGRYRLRETRHLMNLVLFLLANSGLPFSMQGLTRSLSVPTVTQTSRYLQYVEDAYLLFAVPKFNPSFKKRLVTPKILRCG